MNESKLIKIALFLSGVVVGISIHSAFECYEDYALSRDKQGLHLAVLALSGKQSEPYFDAPDMPSEEDSITAAIIGADIDGCLATDKPAQCEQKYWANIEKELVK